jgi:hypothetical protein
LSLQVQGFGIGKEQEQDTDAFLRLIS